MTRLKRGLSVRRRTLSKAVVVITGASSGIGRATALAFARRGARLALVARRESLLIELAAQCEQLSAQALPIRTDVTDPDAVRRLAATVVKVFGRIDVWINNAGIGAVGRFTEIPVQTHEQVIRTNLIAYLYGAHAVLPYFLSQAQGTLINTVSIGGWFPLPYGVSYTASKFGLRGYSEALRAELSGWPKIHVCDVFPAFVDTPGFQHSANYVGRLLKPMPPVCAPERVADVMVSLALKPRASTSVGSTAILRCAIMATSDFIGSASRFMSLACRPIPWMRWMPFECSTTSSGIACMATKYTCVISS